MKQLSLVLLCITTFAWAMEEKNNYQSEPNYQEFKEAITEGDKEKIKKFIKPSIDPRKKLTNEADSRFLSLAIKNENLETAAYILDIVQEITSDYEMTLMDPFYSAGKNDDIKKIHTLMSLEFHWKLKDRGLCIVIEEASSRGNANLIEELFKHYANDIEDPWTSNALSRAVWHEERPENKPILTAIFTHPNAAKKLKQRIESKQFIYSKDEDIETYKRCLEKYGNLESKN